MKLCHNEDGSDAWRLTDGPLQAQMTVTYKDVITYRYQELVGEQKSAEPSGTQIFRNNLSSLNSYLAFFGKTDDSVVGREMFGGFDDGVRLYLDTLSVATRTKSDRRSHLRGWQRAAAAVRDQPANGRTRSSSNESQTEFHRVLRTALANATIPAKTIARRAGASTSALQRWMKGAFPNRRAFPSVHRIEHELGLERNALLRNVPAISRPTQQTSAASIEYRARLRRSTQDRYRLKSTSMTADFLHEWSEFLDYKTSRCPQLERSARGSWRLLPFEKIAGKLPQYACRGDKGCVSASIEMERFRSFAGFLALPKRAGGFGIPLHAAQSLAWLAVPSAVDRYLDFMSDRSGGLIHGGHAGFCAFGKSLTHPVTGYLTQQPSFATRIPTELITGSWENMCGTTLRLYRRWSDDAKEASRKPNEPIQGLLNLAEPLAPLIRTVEQLDRLAAECPAGSLKEAVHKRDALLLSMIIANPLRARNFILMTNREDGSGSLYQRETKQWRLRFGANDFKNDRRATQAAYDAPLPQALNERIECYLAEYRPRLVKANPQCAFLFPSLSGGKWHGLNRHFERLTRRHVTETPGFGPHAMRHVVATDWLRKHPNDFLTAAQLLHDKLETVLRAYAHLRQDDAFNRFEAHLEAVERTMRG